MATPRELSPKKDNSQLYIAIAVAIIVIVITLLLSRRFKKSTRVVLLTGLSDSGKTAIFSKVIFNKAKKSVTSLKENEATSNDLNLKFIDLPGADRLRSRYWEQYRSKARHVIFVVDSSTVNGMLRDLSEYLYVLLSDGIVYKNQIRFTIACNKQDLENAKRKDQVKFILEKELNAIRDTRKGQLGKTSEEEDEDYLASQAGEEISLDALKVNFIETSMNNVDQLIKTIM